MKKFVKARNYFMLNQHAARFADKRTKRNRSRGETRRKAINDQKD